ncbi:hypothetical protein CEY12_13360 [Chryseobacterium sp. T16E-39]|uniref:GLPGLI family protein n=1 Tax=Chryseobacterium sp. T16E-39 TaxID=2015076 RepID=UPI000B5B1DA8|nr:GLPGLI family protein [Chryseobacterium sp. T16E-39]ASK31033.1 hypothetical protein CEY12_13360 [Chryseobacterium sp. T16E-39]
MKNNILLILIFFVVMAKSQTHRFVYDVLYKKDSTSNILTKENYILDIGKNEVLYYTRDFYVADSLITNNIPFPKEMKLNTSNIVSHKIGSNSYDEYDLLENTVLKLQTDNSQNWKLTDEKKKLKNISVQKATTNWGGRTWIAWFTSDIPFQEGPFKFHGLPGLIVEVYDTKNNYRFELVRSTKVDKIIENQFITMSKQMSIPVTWEKYKSTRLKYYESPIGFIRNGMPVSKDDQFFLNDGTKVNSNNLRDINQNLRARIKKYNNPAELDRAIIYP